MNYATQRTVRVGTRGSDLALIQTRALLDSLVEIAPEIRFQIEVIRTLGDAAQPRSGHSQRPDPALQLGDGIFVKAIQAALLEREIDMSVHSLKDLPTEPVKGLVIAAVPMRADPREALVGATFASLAPGAKVGTGSPRRSAQIKWLRPDLQVMPIRGNVPTRIRKARDKSYDAVMVAAAGLERLGLAADEIIDPAVMLPAPGQGALAIETRERDSELAQILACVHDQSTRNAVVAERVVLRELGGGCLLPVAALGRLVAGRLAVDAAVTAPGGEKQIRQHGEGDPDKPLAVGKAVARGLLRQGARELLEQPG